MDTYVLKTNNLTKQYGQTFAVHHVDMKIKKGEIYGFIGKNGAGKTTLMKMIAGIASPTEGDFELFGSSDLNKQRKRIGASIENPSIYPYLTAAQNLEVYCLLLGISDKEVIPKTLKLVNLENTGKKIAKNFSLGMKQRLEIGIALLGNPDFLILDEPINGLDPEGIKQIRELLIALNKEKQITILISSHILGELEKFATYYGIINNGILVEQFSKEELESRCKRSIRLKVDFVERATRVLEEKLNTKNYDILPENTIRLFDYVEDAGLVNTTLAQENITISELVVQDQDLEGYFMELMGGEGHA